MAQPCKACKAYEIASRFVTLFNARWRARLPLGEQYKVRLIECAHYHFGDYVTERLIYFLNLFIAFFTIYSRCEYLKQVPSIDGSLELI
jgi:hypothetical protein